LRFVNTCSEKWVVAQRVGMELANIIRGPPRSGCSMPRRDGTVLARGDARLHQRYPTMPFTSWARNQLEDVRLALVDAGRFSSTGDALVMTNSTTRKPPWLTPKSVTAATSLVWKEVALTGATSSELNSNHRLQPFLNEHWRAQ